MKTTMITLAAILTLFTNVLVAGNDPTNTSSTSYYYSYTTFLLPVHVSLMPAIPSVATYDDAPFAADINHLVPMVPVEAGFEENAEDLLTVMDFAPELPTEADFE